MVRNKFQSSSYITSMLWAFLINVLWFGVNCCKGFPWYLQNDGKICPRHNYKWYFRFIHTEWPWLWNVMAEALGWSGEFPFPRPSVILSALKPIRMTLEKCAGKFSAFLASHGKLQPCPKKLCFKTFHFMRPVGNTLTKQLH